MKGADSDPPIGEDWRWIERGRTAICREGAETRSKQNGAGRPWDGENLVTAPFFIFRGATARLRSKKNQ